MAMSAMISSFGTIPKPNVVKASDFLLLHGNGVSNPDKIAEMVRKTREVEGYRPMPILFNEDDHYLIVAELRGVDRADVEWHLRDGRMVTIRASSDRRTYYREIELGTAVNTQTAVASHSNGVLELRLWKQ